MPKVIPQDMKAISTINAQPDRITSKIKLLIMMDIAGATGNQMSEHSGITPARVSVIRNSPLFTLERDRQMKVLTAQMIDKKSSSIAEGDPVEAKLKSLAMAAVETYETLLTNGRSESVKKVTADSILDRAGYKVHTEKMKVSIEVTEKMASRFEEVLAYNTDKGETPRVSAHVPKQNIPFKLGDENARPRKNDRETKVSIKAEMPI